RRGRSDASTYHRYQKNQAGRASNHLPSAPMESEMLKLGQVFRIVQLENASPWAGQLRRSFI
ncbi:MAG: hypothetical protein WBW81_10290, partial [Methylocella sp.]